MHILIVIALLDTSGTVVVKYTCDAWGNNVVSNANNVIITDENHITPRIHSGSRKEAYDKAFYKGGKRKPIFHNDKHGPHFHPNVPKGHKFSHWHFFFSLTILASIGSIILD